MKTKHITLLILRILIGGMLAYAGIMKLMDMTTTAGYFADMGITSAIVLWLVCVGEALAGLGILFGVYTQIAAAGAAIIMAGAVYYTSRFAGTSEVITTSVLLIMSLILTYSGSGKYALKPCPCSIKDLENSPPTPTPTPAATTPSNPSL